MGWVSQSTPLMKGFMCCFKPNSAPLFYLVSWQRTVYAAVKPSCFLINNSSKHPRVLELKQQQTDSEWAHEDDPSELMKLKMGASSSCSLACHSLLLWYPIKTSLSGTEPHPPAGSSTWSTSGASSVELGKGYLSWPLTLLSCVTWHCSLKVLCTFWDSIAKKEKTTTKCNPL